MNYTNRSTDPRSTAYERKERLYQKAGLWYFRTREEAAVGPFRYRCEAEAMLARFIQQVQEDQQKRQARAMKRKPHFRTAALV